MSITCSQCQSENPDTSKFCNNCATPLGPDGQTPVSPTISLQIPFPVLSKGSLIAGKYRVVEEIGRGGMGIVYRAHDESLDRDVALKVLPASCFGDPAARARLLHEARTASQLNHPNICTIHEVGEAEGQAFIAMEFVAGEPLSVLLTAGPLPAEKVLRYGLQLAEALGHAHERGVLHRDLKSANVVITSEGRAKVLDFGLAKRLSEIEMSDVTRSLASLTSPGMVAGTPAYMAPELLGGEPADVRTDIWALGVVLYEMAAGVRPFQGNTGFELSSAILNEPPEPLSAQVPAALSAVIKRCLEKEPGRRYQQAGNVRAALETIERGTVTPWVAWRCWLTRRRWLALAASVVMLAAILVGLNVGRLRERLYGRSDAPTGAIPLAVLPFTNLTGDPAKEYVSEGLTQEMITELGRLQGLNVRGRMSIMRYRKVDIPVDQIGRELGVDYILGGSAQIGEGRVRVSAELIRVRDQTRLWGETYERDAAGILALQSEVARNVAGSLALKLFPAEQAHLARTSLVNPEAYDAYLKGLHDSKKLTPGGFDTAQQYFELALEKEPGYAPAYAGISFVWLSRQSMTLAPPREATPKAKAAALKALALDGTSAEAHFALASVLAWCEWEWAAAEPEFKRAFELNPSYPDARVFYSQFLNFMGRPDEAMIQIKLGLELDPLNPLFQAVFAMALMYRGRYDEAIVQLHDTLKTSPGYPVALSTLRSVFHMKRMYREALDAWKASFAASGDRELEDALESGSKENGYQGALRRVAETLVARSKKSYVTPWRIGTLYTRAGMKDEALQWLEKAFEEHDYNMPYLSVDPIFDVFRDDPRFQSLLRRMNLPASK
jgi:TolB-like protein/predicted Ser/Thr protein kinase